MRRIHTPPSLKWLINKKARILGEINDLEKLLPIWLASSKSYLDDAEHKASVLRESYLKTLSLGKKLPKLKSQLEAIEIILSLHEIQINTDLIIPIKTNKKKSYGPHGSITRGIYECLKLNNRSVTTKEITLFILYKNGLDKENTDLVEMNEAVGKILRTMAHQGKVERLHALKGINEGIWKIPSLKLAD